MKRIWKYLFLLLSTSAVGQNLVPNASFEMYDTCPDFTSQMSRAIGWWSARPTADYFNTCAPYYPPPINCVHVPENSLGYRLPASGNAFAGVISRGPDGEGGESIGCQLLTPLTVGIRYYASFKVSASSHANTGNWRAINKLGVLFSTVRYDSLSPSPISCNNCAQVCSDSIISDTLNWTRIKGSFVADSNYSFISIGRFNSNSLTDTLQLVGTNCYSYYFIDDVCISNDSNYTYNYSYTGINGLDKEAAITYFPNPTNDFITINDRERTVSEVSIFNSLGELLKTYPTGNVEFYTINLNGFSKGIYYLVAYRKNQSKVSHLIIKF